MGDCIYICNASIIESCLIFIISFSFISIFFWHNIFIKLFNSSKSKRISLSFSMTITAKSSYSIGASFKKMINNIYFSFLDSFFIFVSILLSLSLLCSFANIISIKLPLLFSYSIRTSSMSMFISAGARFLAIKKSIFSIL